MIACHCISADSYTQLLVADGAIALGACARRELRFGVDLFNESSPSQLNKLPHHVLVKWSLMA
jgi:hypothetical protein